MVNFYGYMEANRRSEETMAFSILVCIKAVPDMSSGQQLVADGNRIALSDIAWCMNSYDACALEAALVIKDAQPQITVDALSVGPDVVRPIIRRAMAMGADRSILIETERPADSILTARALAAAIRSDGEPWIILAGKESIDSEGMQTHFRLAADLGMPVATNVIEVQAAADEVQVACERDPGTVDRIRMTPPCVIGAGKGLNSPKYPTFPDIMKARKKEVRRIDLDELSIEPPAAATTVEALTAAEERRTPKELTGSAAQIAARIVDILKNEAKVI